MERGMRPQEGGPKKMIVKKLNFDEAQKAAFQESIEQHQQKTRPLHEELQQVKSTYLLNQDQSAAEDSLSKRFGIIHAELLKAHKEHFADLKRICKPEQMDAYKELMENIGSAFGPPGQRRMKP